MREFLVAISEFLFYLTGGEMLLNTFWFIPWVFFGMLLGSAIFFVTAHIKSSALVAIVTVLTFFAMTVIVASPGAIQSQMMTECRTSDATITVNEETREATVSECRLKSNYYKDFGDWEIMSTVKVNQ